MSRLNDSYTPTAIQVAPLTKVFAMSNEDNIELHMTRPTEHTTVVLDSYTNLKQLNKTTYQHTNERLIPDQDISISNTDSPPKSNSGQDMSNTR